MTQPDGIEPVTAGYSIYPRDAAGQLQDAIFYTEPAATAAPKLRALMGL